MAQSTMRALARLRNAGHACFVLRKVSTFVYGVRNGPSSDEISGRTAGQGTRPDHASSTYRHVMGIADAGGGLCPRRSDCVHMHEFGT